MYFAASVKVDLDIAGNQTARRLGGGDELAAWPRHSALVKTAMLRRLCLAVTRLPAEKDVSPRSSPLGDVSRGGTSVTQRQKFHADDVKSVRNRFASADY